MFTLKDIERLKQAGFIKGYSISNGGEKCQKKGKGTPKKGSKIKEWIGKNLWAWAQANKLTLETEHKFHPERKWRFDWALPEKMIGLEYEGVFSEKSRHTTAKGFTGDAEKYNQAQKLGWRVFRYTAINYKDIINDLNKLI